MQRKSESSASASGASNPASSIYGSDGGEPLSGETRALMEPRFGSDLSQVRVHTDAGAGESARSVNALAYTVGRDIVFGAGQYAPQTSAGQKLLAHELTHFIQQSAATFQPMLQRACINDRNASPQKKASCPEQRSKVRQPTSILPSSVRKRKRPKKNIPRRREISVTSFQREGPDPACTADGHASRATRVREAFPTSGSGSVRSRGRRLYRQGDSQKIRRLRSRLPRIQAETPG